MLANELRYLLTWFSCCAYIVAVFFAVTVARHSLHFGAAVEICLVVVAFFGGPATVVAWKTLREVRGAPPHDSSAPSARVVPILISLGGLGAFGYAIASELASHLAAPTPAALDALGVPLVMALGAAWLSRNELRRLFGMRVERSTAPSFGARLDEYAAIATSAEPAMRSLRARVRVAAVVRVALLVGAIPLFVALYGRFGTTVAIVGTFAVVAGGGIAIKPAMGLKDGLLL